MNRDRILHRVREIIAEVFNSDLGMLKDDAQKSDIEGWDSLGHLRLCMMIEKEFNIRLTIQEMADLNSVFEIVEAVLKHGL